MVTREVMATPALTAPVAAVVLTVCITTGMAKRCGFAPWITSGWSVPLQMPSCVPIHMLAELCPARSFMIRQQVLWTTTGSMHGPRYQQPAIPLGSGKVLVMGGVDSNYVTLSTAELYDPTGGGTW